MTIDLREWVLAISAFASAALAGVFVRIVVGGRLAALIRKSSSDVDDLALKSFRGHVPLWFVLAGASVAVRLAPVDPEMIPMTDRACGAAFMLSVCLALSRFGAGWLEIYARRSGAAVGTTSLMKHVVRLGILAVGVLLVLSNLGLSITPLITALGVGSLAVALALQPTLSNLFAGIHLTLSRPVAIGDYVELETGQQGYVVDISWRETKIRELPNNLIEVPNARLVEMVVKNYHLPDIEQAVLVEVGVAYGSDLEAVERVTVEVAKESLLSVPGAVPSFDPFIRYHTFGDSAILFTVILRVSDFPQRYALKHDFLKRLKARYDREGIEIPFPQRVLHLPAGRSVPVLLACALFAAGCGDATRHAESGPGARRVALMLPPSERAVWEPVARTFEASHPGVRVDLTEGPQSTDLRENLYTAALLAGDPSYDLVYLDVTWTPKFAAAGWLLPLDAEIVAEERSRFLPAALAAGLYRGRLYRVPVRTDVGMLYWRRDWLDEAGRAPPQTFAELTAAASALQSPPDRWGFVWQGKQYEGLVCLFLEVLRGHGGYWVDPATLAVGLDRAEAVAALSFLTRAIRVDRISPPGVTTYQEEESRRLFQDGRAVFLRNWPYAWRLAQAEDSPLRGRVGAGPMVRAEGGRRGGTLGGWGLGISRFSREPALALAFIRHATTLESQRLLCERSGYAPARADAYADSALLAANPFLATIERAHRDAAVRPVIPRYALASDVLQRHLSAALSGGADPERALREAARETRLLLGRPAAGGPG